MKTRYFTAFLLTLAILGLHAQNAVQTTATPPSTDQSGVPAPTAFQVVQRGANFKVWQRTTYERTPNGKVVPHLHSYTELGSGMHHRDASGNWIESQEQIEPYSTGAIAQNGQYQVIFANNLNSAGAIDQQTPDGKELRSSILGLAYYDNSSGQSVMLAEVQDSQGQMISANQVLYTDAFSGVSADVRYTYKKGSFEQDVIVRAQPPSPATYNLNPDTTEIQVLTEFINPPDLVPSGMQRPADGDQDISWGQMCIGRGQTYDLANPNLAGQLVPVRRQYVTIDNRQILVEKVPLKLIQKSLSALPLQSGITRQHLFKTASRSLALPKTPLARTVSAPMPLATTSFDRHGYVLDYVELNTSQASYDFQSDTTYFVSSTFAVGGPGAATFEGGTVIKFRTDGIADAINLYGAVYCNGSPYRPVVFTSENDDAVGDATDISTNPIGWYENPVGGLSALNFNWHDIRVKYAQYGIYSYVAQMHDCQFFNCLYPLVADMYSGGYITATNILIVNADSAFSGVDFSANVSQLTVNNCTNLIKDWYGDTDDVIDLTNSLLVNVQNLGDGILQSNYTAWVTDPYGTVLQTVGGGSAYLPAGSIYHGAGTTNVDPYVLADIAGKTTWPPFVFYSPDIYFSSNLDLYPQAQRDTNQFPDLGYHYDPLDYIFGPSFMTNCTITFNPGTAVGGFGSNTFTYVFAPAFSGHLVSQGLANDLNHLTEYTTVQEQTGQGWETPSYGLFGIWTGNNTETIDIHFTDWSVLAQDAGHFHITGGSYMPNLSHCQFHGGTMKSYWPSVSFTNCLFERVNIDIEPNDTNVDVFRNNLFYYGTFGFSPSVTNCIIMDNDFECTAIPDWLGGEDTPYVGGHNAFVTNYDRLDPAFTNDLILSAPLTYQASWYGNYYQPPGSPLINAGSTTANQVGLYHYTTQTNQVPETNSIVDIGYHYVATDQYGNPLDSNGDGIPDYIEDINGDGLDDPGDVWDWRVPMIGSGTLAFPNGFNINVYEPKPMSQIP